MNDNRRSAGYGKVPEKLPMNSVQKNQFPELPVNSVQRNPVSPIASKIPEPKPLSVIYSQNEMLESQTVTLIGQTTAEHEPSVAETGRITEQVGNEDFRAYRRGTA